LGGKGREVEGERKKKKKERRRLKVERGKKRNSNGHFFQLVVSGFPSLLLKFR